jgi:hypothetical protein
MESYAIVVTLVAIGLGIGWWIDHRGKAGIISDLQDVGSDAKGIASKVKK